MATQTPKKIKAEVMLPPLWKLARRVSSKKTGKIMEVDKDRKEQGPNSRTDVTDTMASVNASLADESCGPSSTPSFLPELRTGACQMYHRRTHKQPPTLHQQPSEDGYDSLQSTCCHGGHGASKSMAARLSQNCTCQDECKLQANRDMNFREEMDMGNSKTCTQAVLPKETIKSEDFVTTWLQYGSKIQGSHFPEIVSSNPHHITHTVLCKSGKKSTLRPIQTRKTRGLSSKTSAVSNL